MLPCLLHCIFGFNKCLWHYRLMIFLPNNTLLSLLKAKGFIPSPSQILPFKVIASLLDFLQFYLHTTAHQVNSHSYIQFVKKWTQTADEKWPRNLQDQIRLPHKLITRHFNAIRLKMNLYPSGRAARNFMNQSTGTRSVYNFSNSLKTVSQTQRITSRIQGFSIKKLYWVFDPQR